MKLLNNASMVPFYGMLIAIAFFAAIVIAIVFVIIRQAKRKEKIDRYRYPQAVKPLSKTIPFNTIKN